MTFVVRPLYVKITDKHGVSRIEERQAWDAERLFASLDEQFTKEGGFVQAATKEQWDRYRFGEGRRR